MKAKKTVSFSTNMSKETKELMERFCKVRGMRINHLVEKAVLEYIEDEMDRSILEERLLENSIEWRKKTK